jgi:hypothetical protein
LNDQEVPDTSGHGVHKSRDNAGAEYELTSRSIARYMRINQLVKEKTVHDTVSVRLPVGTDQKYFAGMRAREKSEIIVKALEAWFEGNGQPT